MRHTVLAFLFFFVLGFDVPFEKSWSKFNGWCFQPKKVLSTFVCFPRRWGAVDVVAMEGIKLTKKHTVYMGYKWTYAPYRYEFWKAKTKIGHGPYINFKLKF